MTYPKRLIEVDLPIKRISAHARREKSIRHGHISTLHIWWARRPLASCRAVICAALWPDPADPLCPASFRERAQKSLLEWTTHERQALLSAQSRQRFEAARQNPKRFDDPEELRRALLDFIADFSNWDNSTKKEYLETSRALTQSAHEALGGQPGTKPLVVDPFAGGGSIPLEALRVGADTFASDLNPVAVLLNKVVLEYIPKYGQRLANEVREWGEWVKKEAEMELAEFYPKDPDGATPIAYVWARTIQCEGPGCGIELPLIRSLWLSNRPKHSVGIRLIPRPAKRRIDIAIVTNATETDIGEGTIRRGSATCPCCGYTTPIKNIRSQLKAKSGGSADAILICVVTTRSTQQGRVYRTSTEMDLLAASHARSKLMKLENDQKGPLSIVPDESTQLYHSFVNRGPIYGMTSWRDYYLPRQALALATYVKHIREAARRIERECNHELALAVQTCLAIGLDRLAFYTNALAYWVPRGEYMGNIMPRQAIAMTFDFAECVPLSESTGGFHGAIQWVQRVCEANVSAHLVPGQVSRGSATDNPLPDNSCSALITDPPYYYSVQYSDLSDFFYVWLRRSIGDRYPDLFSSTVTPKDSEIIVESPAHEHSSSGKNQVYYESKMRLALTEARRVLMPTGIGVVVFAHTSTAGWEVLLQATVDSGWIVTGSWPIDTEMPNRVLARDRSVLGSSVHLVCRPRKSEESSLVENIGDWRDVLAALPKRIHEWMPRLSAEGVVGADAIFACLGPALEIFSRYSRVEKASGEQVKLKEYLEYVWAAVAKEALNMIFEGADATGFEEDARLTAMWLWTLSTGNNGNGKRKLTEDDEEIDEEGDSGKPKKITGVYALEYDAARKIAQGLGAHLEKLSTVVEVKGDTAHLLPVSERTRFLFGKDETQSPSSKRKKKEPQLKLGFMKEIEEIETKDGWGTKSAPRAGSTVLDRLHQSMILFAAGRSEALKRFLVEEGAGNDQRFWRLAQALSALYPKSSDEKRWVDGVLARKKGLGF